MSSKHKKSLTSQPNVNNKFKGSGAKSKHNSSCSSIGSLPDSPSPTLDTDPVLAKLDDITSSILSLGGEIGGLRNEISGLRSEFKEIQKSVDFANENAQEAKKIAIETKSKLSDVDSKYDEAMLNFERLKNENENLREQMLRNESQERRSNLILEGIPEKKDENQSDLLNSVYQILETMKLEIDGIDDVKQIQIARIHRNDVGKPKTKEDGSEPKPKPVIFRLQYYPHRMEIWKKRSELKDSGYWLSEDYPAEINKRRQVMNMVCKEARKQDKRAVVFQDKIKVDEQVYTIKTLDRLPESLRPCELATKRSDDYTGFYTVHSPLSNFHAAKFKFGGITYVNNEQFYQHNRAKENGDDLRASEILKTNDPAAIYRIGKNVKIIKPDWDDKALEIMEIGCMEKFKQNKHLAKFLLSTGTTTLVEASPTNRFFGVGLSLNHPDIFKPEKWHKDSKNWLGKILEKVRDAIKDK